MLLGSRAVNTGVQVTGSKPVKPPKHRLLPRAPRGARACTCVHVPVRVRRVRIGVADQVKKFWAPGAPQHCNKIGCVYETSCFYPQRRLTAPAQIVRDLQLHWEGDDGR
jgi:hypothetical protein